MSSHPPNGNDPSEQPEATSGADEQGKESPWEKWERENRPQAPTPTNPYGETAPGQQAGQQGQQPGQQAGQQGQQGQQQGPYGQQSQQSQQGPYGQFNPPTSYSPYQGWVAPPKPGVIPLRPLTVGEILDGAFQACRKNPIATFGTAIIVTVISQLVVGILTTLLLGQGGIANLASPDVSTTQALAVAGAAGLSGVITILFSSVLARITEGLLLIPVARAILNRKTSFTEMFRFGGKRILPLLGFVLLTLAAYAIASTLFVLLAVAIVSITGAVGSLVLIPLGLGFIVVLVWVSIKLSFVPPAIVLESAGIFTAIARSWNLIRSSWWRVFGITLLGAVIVTALTTIVGTLVDGVLGISTMTFSNPEEQLAMLTTLNIQQIISYIVVGIVGGVGAAFAAALLGLLYVDVRMRREGFETVLIKEMEGTADLPGAGPHSQNGGTNPGTSYGYRPGQTP